MLAFVAAILSFASTMIGGFTALKNQQHLTKILGFTAGIILGVIAFDLLPEVFHISFEENIDTTIPMIALVVGFLLFHILEKSILMHYDHANHYSPHRHPYVGVASALALIGHSFLDGVGIGLGFQAGETIGIAVAIAVIAHDFADGLNTVSLMMSSRNSSRRSVIFLVFDALAPIAGIVVGQMIHLDPIQLVVYLGFFTGFLLYIGASDILPQAHEKGTSRLTIGMTVAGVVLMYIVTQLSH